jgi:hypothetical protein
MYILLLIQGNLCIYLNAKKNLTFFPERAVRKKYRVFNYINSSRDRPFSMKIRHVSQATDLVNENYQNYYALLEKPFKCTFCCLARPEMTARNGNTYFGKVSEPFTCCDPKYHIMDPENRIKWKITADCCQWGLGCCGEALFPVFSGEKDVLKPENSDGYVKKLSGGFKEIISDDTNFEISFPSNMTAEDKFMLIAATLMIDYRHFETDDNKSHH